MLKLICIFSVVWFIWTGANNVHAWWYSK